MWVLLRASPIAKSDDNGIRSFLVARQRLRFAGRVDAVNTDPALTSNHRGNDGRSCTEQ
jgi:hypothetical protein